MTSPARSSRTLHPALVSLPALLLACALAAPAHAGDGDPEVDVTADGTVVGHVVVGASADRVQTYLADIAFTRKLAKDVTDVEVVKSGGCELVTTYASGFIDVMYVARRCPTETGWIETLLESKQFADYYAEWIVTPVATGMQLTFRLRTEMDMPVPARLVRGTLKRNVKQTLETIQGQLGAPRQSPSVVADPSR